MSLFRSGGQHRRRRSGVALLEAALALPFIVLIGMGTLEFAHYFWIKNAYTNAVREALQLAVSGTGTTSDVVGLVYLRVKESGVSGWEGGDGDVLVNGAYYSGALSSIPRGARVAVSFSQDYDNAGGVRTLNLVGAYKPITVQLTTVK